MELHEVVSPDSKPSAKISAGKGSIEERSRFVPFFAVWPVFEPLAGEPGFEELKARAGIGVATSGA